MSKNYEQKEKIKMRNNYMNSCPTLTESKDTISKPLNFQIQSDNTNVEDDVCKNGDALC